MKAEWTLANHPEIKGLNACAEKVLDILRLDIGPTVRVKGGKWEATVFVAKFDSRCRIEVSDRSPHVWFRDVAMPTTAEELAHALLSTVLSVVNFHRDLYAAASAALAAEDGVK